MWSAWTGGAVQNMTVAQRILVKFPSPVADSGQFRMSLGFPCGSYAFLDGAQEHPPANLLRGRSGGAAPPCYRATGSLVRTAWTKEAGKALGPSGGTTHSLQAEGATDELQGGASFEMVKRVGRWTSMLP